jgi:hypothetical protein
MYVWRGGGLLTWTGRNHGGRQARTL